MTNSTLPLAGHTRLHYPHQPLVFNSQLMASVPWEEGLSHVGSSWALHRSGGRDMAAPPAAKFGHWTAEPAKKGTLVGE